MGGGRPPGPPTSTPSPFWPDGLADWVGLFGDGTTVLVAIAALTLWLRGRNPIVQFALRDDRRRTIGAVLRAAGHPRRRVRRACQAATDDVLVGRHEISVAAELRWLDETAGLGGLRTPVALFGVGRDAHEDLHELSRAYTSYAHRLRSRGLLGGGTAPVLAKQADAAARTATRLTTHALFALETSTAEQGGGVRLVVAGGATELTLDHLRLGRGPGKGVDALAVSHLPERLVFPGTLGERLCTLDGVRPSLAPVLTASESRALRSKLSGKFFDGALPSLRLAVAQRDPASGWIRLHVVLAETAYSGVVATHNVGSRGIGRARADLRGEARLLTLSCLPITQDDRIVVVRRSRHVITGQGQLATGVNGNLEMRPRFGIALDQDDDGVPSPLLALARESREELGIDLAPEDFEIAGLVRFESDQEVGVTSLLTSCRIPFTAVQVASQIRYAHATEGRWENEGEVWGLPVPTTAPACRELLGWSLPSRTQQPHLAASLVAICYPILVDDLGGDVAGVDRLLEDLADGPDTGDVVPAGAVRLVADAREDGATAPARTRP